MLTEDEARNWVEIALRGAPEETEVVLTSTRHGLTRLANGGIHQNVETLDTTARVRVALGKRVGVATSNRIDADSLRTLVARAEAIARVSAPNSAFPGLPTAPPPVSTPVPAYAPDDVTPERRAETAAEIVRTGKGNGAAANGHVSTSETALAVGNSRGIRAYHASVDAGVMAIMTKNDASGYAKWDGVRLSDAPVDALAGRACTRCLAAAGANCDTAEPGSYTVILEPAAVAEFLSMLAFIGLGATAFQEGRSFMSGNVGTVVAGANITLTDDTYHAGMIPHPFDYEGVPRQAVPLIEGGTARGVVYDSYTAHGEGRASTGHALPAPNPYGPLPLHLVLHPGAESYASLLAGVDHGILVTRFHYVNVVHPKETILTGMTRDGTFRIEHGAVSRPLKNLRFTQSVLETLKHAMLENTLTLVNQEGLYCLVPAMRVEGFNFTS
jgi:predicted Zn-dependent protease